MKIKLTEDQYKRLLVENDKSFLDGKVEFPHIGNKVNKFIVKLFNYIHHKVGTFKPSNNREIREIIIRDFGLTDGEAELLRHNYANFSHDIDTDDFSEFIGADLEFYGELKFNTRIPMSAYMYGTMDGYLTGHATSIDDFIDKLENNDWEDVDTDWVDDIESYPEDAEWEIDTDYTSDRVSDEIMDLRRQGDEDDIRDRIEIMHQ
tara:strand:- start:425 stop:1039 length:615 start_codon:yes stop_codon:yes gene_type:complete